MWIALHYTMIKVYLQAYSATQSASDATVRGAVGCWGNSRMPSECHGKASSAPLQTSASDPSAFNKVYWGRKAGFTWLEPFLKCSGGFLTWLSKISIRLIRVSAIWCGFCIVTCHYMNYTSDFPLNWMGRGIKPDFAAIPCGILVQFCIIIHRVNLP